MVALAAAVTLVEAYHGAQEAFKFKKAVQDIKGTASDVITVFNSVSAVQYEGGTYKGGWDNSANTPLGDGVLSKGDLSIACKEWADGKLNGAVTITKGTGETYKCRFESGICKSSVGPLVVGARKCVFTGSLDVQFRPLGECKIQSADGKCGGTMHFACGLPNGRGEWKWDDTLVSGTFKDGVLDGGDCHVWYANGDRYHGSIVKNNLHGIGTYTWKNGDSVKCSWSTGQITGVATLIKKSAGLKIEGPLKSAARKDTEPVSPLSCPHGVPVTVTFSSGQVETGPRQPTSGFAGRLEGKCVHIKFADGSISSGNKVNGEWDGQCTITYKRDGESDDKYTGQLSNGKNHGQGKYEGKLGTYEGGWKDGFKHGTGKWYSKKDGATYEGEVAGGRAHGTGKYRCSNGTVYDGSWSNNKWKGSALTLVASDFTICIDVV